MSLVSKLRRRFHSQSKGAEVKGFWHGEPLSAVHWACLRSFLNEGHSFDLYTYQIMDVPDGVRLKNAAEVIPLSQIFFHNNIRTGMPDVAPFTDYFRLKVLYDYGGWWCDVDTVCLSEIFPKFPRVWARQAPEYRPDSVSNGQLFFNKKDWVAERLLRACEDSLAHIERRESLGPELISRILNELDLPLDMGATAATFYPLRYIENFKLWLPEFREEVKEKMEDAVFLPVYQSFPIHLGFNNKKLPPKGSFLHDFIRELAPEFPTFSHNTDEFRGAVQNWLRENQNWAISRLTSVSKDNILDWIQK